MSSFIDRKISIGQALCDLSDGPEAGAKRGPGAVPARRRSRSWKSFWQRAAAALAITAAGFSGGGILADEPVRLQQVVLFSSGVGFYEHKGEVEGNAALELQFPTENINDLLKSMVLQDLGGGKIQAVTYSSRDPITRTLGTFAIDLTNNPTLANLLAQIRGQRVEIESPNKITGLVVGIETREVARGDNVQRVEVLNLLTDAGLKSVPLDAIGRIQILDEKLNNEFKQALAVLAAGKAEDKKAVTLQFQGQGKRPVRVGYIQESPVWKTSYRLVLADDAKPFLQGWAIIENTTEHDWKDVGLTLVSGRPISFRMDLYQPLYIDRPLVQPELYASLRPQTYEQDLVEREEEFLERADRDGEPAKKRESLAGRASGPAEKQFKALEDRKSPSNRWGDIGEGVATVAQGGDVGELFQYVIETPVTLARRQSAMLPIVNQSLEGDKLVIYSASVHAKHPLNGLKMKNSTGLHLLQGPITVFDDGVYAGDAQITDLSPGSTRIVSYALDLDTEVATQTQSQPEELLLVKIVRGTLETSRKFRRTTKYTIKNSGAKTKTVLVEQPLGGDWKLLSPQPEETTRDRYRFQTKAEPGKPVEMAVEEEFIQRQTILASNLDDNTIRFYLQQSIVTPTVKQALQEVIKRKAAIAAVVAERGRLEGEINVIGQEQARIRENMAQLARSSDLYARYVKKFGEQEDRIEALRTSVAELQKKETELRKSLETFVLGLDLA